MHDRPVTFASGEAQPIGTSEIWAPRLYQIKAGPGRSALLLVTADPHPTGERVGIEVRAGIIGEALGGEARLCRMQGSITGVQVSLSDLYVEVRSGWHRQGIGTICLARLVMWAKHYHPSAPLKPFMIGSAHGDAEGLVRLYGRLNMTWQRPRSPGPWHADAMLCSALAVPPLPEALDLATVLDDGQFEARTCRSALDGAKDRLARLASENARLRFQRLWVLTIGGVVLAACMAAWALTP